MIEVSVTIALIPAKVGTRDTILVGSASASANLVCNIVDIQLALGHIGLGSTRILEINFQVNDNDVTTWQGRLCYKKNNKYYNI